jgi:Kef-type K+ transport system membrane component KefB
MEFSFLPQFPPVFSNLMLFGIMLLAGLLGGQVIASRGYLPKITGYMAIGFLLGPAGLNWVSHELLFNAQVFVDLALGIILFQLGRRLDLAWLRHDRWLLATAIADAVLSFTFVYWVLSYFGVARLQAALAASVAIATSPAVLLMVARELGAEGQVTNRAMSLAAINNVIGLITFTMLLSPLHLRLGSSTLKILLHPGYLLAGSLLLGYVGFLLLLAFARFIGKVEAGQFILLVGVVLLTVGSAHALNLPVMLTMLAFGIISKNFDRRHDIMEIEFGYASQLFFVVLFVVVGARIDPTKLLQIGLIVPAILIARLAGKMLAVYSFARPSGLSLGQATMLGIALFPMAAIAAGMTRSVAGLYPEFGSELTAIMASSIMIVEIFGPILTQFALTRAGEAHPDRP